MVLVFLATCHFAGCGSSPTTTSDGKTDSATETIVGEKSAEQPALISTESASESAEPMPTYSDEAFRIAAHDGNIDLVRRALASGTEVDAADPVQGFTALLMAAYNGHSDVVKLLLDHDAKVDARDRQGKTPLLHACTGPFADAARMLIDAGADVNATEATENFTPLMTAAALGQKEVVELLIQRGADKSLVDLDGDTALSHATNSGHQEIVDLLQ
jgi:ankyrin repeat protein